MRNTAETPDWQTLASLCRVPEHSLPLMQAMSGASPLVAGRYLFYHRDAWLIAIGYPLEGVFRPEEFATALKIAESECGSAEIHAILPMALSGEEQAVIEKDRYHVLPAAAPIPARLRGPLKRLRLEVSESASFTAAHRRLWAEFMQLNAASMSDRVAELYAVTPDALQKAGGNLRLLDARDQDGNIVASLLLDYAPRNFTSYILGAHSRKHYVPHAADLLFAAMLENARASGKRFIHLGLGVNAGILRFKEKWGSRPSWPFFMYRWQRRQRETAMPAARLFMSALLASSSAGTARQIVRNEPRSRPFAMIWQVEKQGRVSWLAGTAHFFPHSFDSSLRKLFKRVHTVLFEGPLDAAFMDQVEQAGRKPASDTPLLLSSLNEEEIGRLARTVNGSPGLVGKILGAPPPGRTDVRWLLGHCMPWYAFFTLWTRFLERQGWRQSVDLEAWRIAQAMDRKVIGMETLEEQLESLASLPPQRAINFFRACNTWKRRARQNVRAYLAGDLELMMGSSAEFPTRTEHIVSRRDQRFRERMRPYLEAGGCAVFVGSAHLVNLLQMLAHDGFTLRQSPFGLLPVLRACWRRFRSRGEKVAW